MINNKLLPDFIFSLLVKSVLAKINFQATLTYEFRVERAIAYNPLGNVKEFFNILNTKVRSYKQKDWESMTDTELCEEARKGYEQAQEIIILRHQAIIRKNIAYFTKKYVTISITIDDVFSCCLMGFVKAISIYDDNHTEQFTTFVQFKIRDEINELLRHKQYSSAISEEKALLLNRIAMLNSNNPELNVEDIFFLYSKEYPNSNISLNQWKKYYKESLQAKEIFKSASLNRSNNSEDDGAPNIIEVVPDPSDSPEAAVINKEESTDMYLKCLKRYLTPLQLRIFCDSIGYNQENLVLSTKEIAEKERLSQRTIQRNLKYAMEIMNSAEFRKEFMDIYCS